MADDTLEPTQAPTATDADYDEVVEHEDGSATIAPPQKPGSESSDFYQNLAERLSPEQEARIVSRYLDLIEKDKTSREDRDKQYEEGIRRTGLGKDAPGGADFEGASRVVHPLLAEACVDFEARQINHIFPVNTDPVVPDLRPNATPDEIESAERKAYHMSWQLTEQMEEYRACMEKMLTQIPLAGVGYLKLYYSTHLKRPCCEFVPVDDIYLPFEADDFYTAQRVSHKWMLSEIAFEARVTSGFYVDQDYSLPEEKEESHAQKATDKIEGKAQKDYQNQNVRTGVDIYALDDFEIDPLVEEDTGGAPYILTIDLSSRKICSIYRNWEETDEYKCKLNWLIEFGFIPWRGAYPIGLTHLIGSVSGALTGALRALLDSAHINNSATLVTMKGSGLTGQSRRIQIGSTVEIANRAGTDDIRKLMQPVPFNPPSGVLMELIGFLTQTGQGVVRTAHDDVAEDNKNMPVGTKMANIQEGMVVYSGIHARMYYAQLRALKTLHLINKLYDVRRPTEGYDLERYAEQKDYLKPFNVQPASDPSIFCETQKVNQLQFALQMQAMAPHLYDDRALHKWAHSIMNTPNIEKIMPDPPTPQDENPAAENIKMGMGQPATALPDQDHAAHLAAHADFMLSPMYGMNPIIAITYLPQAIEHMKQHLLLAYGDAVMEMVEGATGQPITELMDPHLAVTTAMSQVIAAVSEDALNAEGMQPEIQKALQAMQKGYELMQQIVPPPPEDPGVMLAKAEMEKAKNDKVSDERRDALEEKKLAIEDKQTTFDQTTDYLQKDRDLDIKERKQTLEEIKTGVDLAHLAKGGAEESNARKEDQAIRKEEVKTAKVANNQKSNKEKENG